MTPVSRFERHVVLDIEAAGGWALETVAAPAPMFGANGLAVGPDGLVYIAEWLGDRVTTWDPDARRIGTAVSIEDPLDGPDDVAFDSAGTLFVTSYGTGKVFAKSRDGVLRILLDDAPGANGVTVHEDRLFVTEFREHGRTLEVDLVTPGRFRVISDATDHGNALQMGADGRLYVPNVLAGTITAIDPITGDGEVVAQDLGMISAVKFDPKGRLAVSLQYDGVLAIDLATGERAMLAARPHGEMVDNFCFDATGRLYLTLSSRGQLERYRPGRPTEPEVLLPGGFIGPYGLASSGSGTLLVADYLGVYDLGADGTVTLFSRVLDRGPLIDAVSAGPDEAIGLSRSGDVFRLARGSAETTTLVSGTGSRDFSGLRRSPGARSLCRDGDGIAVGFAGGGIARLTMDGQVRERIDTGLDSADALTVSGPVLACADEHRGTVFVLRDGIRSLIGGLDRPSGVAVLGDSVVVCERGTGSVSLHPASGGEPAVVASGLPLRLPTPLFREDGRRAPVLVDEAGDILIGCAGDGSVRRLVAPSHMTTATPPSTFTTVPLT